MSGNQKLGRPRQDLTKAPFGQAKSQPEQEAFPRLSAYDKPMFGWAEPLQCLKDGLWLSAKALIFHAEAPTLLLLAASLVRAGKDLLFGCHWATAVNTAAASC